jgi:iron(III) transport system permease protein
LLELLSGIMAELELTSSTITTKFDNPRLVVTLFSAVVAAFILTPLFFLFLNSFQIGQPGEPVAYGVDAWIMAFTTPGIIDATYNSFSLAFTRQLIALVVGILVAWVLARTDIPMRGTLEFMFWLSFFLPALPVTLGWILLLEPKQGLLNQLLLRLPFIYESPFNIYSYWGIVWAHLTATSLAIKVMLLTPAFRNLDAALEESSRVVGAGPIRTLFYVIVPVMMPAILVSFILGFMRSLEAFEIELILGVPIGLHVFSTKIHQFLTNEPTQFAPAAALGSLFLLVLLLMVAFQRMYLGRRAFTTVSGRGFSARPISLGRWRYPVFLLVLFLALLITAVPVAFLSLGTFMKLFGFFEIEDPWTLDNWQHVLNDPTLIRSLKNTLSLAFWTAAFLVVLGSLVAYIITKTHFRVRAILDFISWLPWAIPGILVGMALLLTFLLVNRIIPLYGTMSALVISMVISGVPLSVQVIKSFLMQLGDELEEAARISGASWFYTYVHVLLPLLFPCLVIVGLLGFIAAARNISTVVLLATAQTRTVSLLMLDFTAGGELEKATVVAVIIVVIVVIAALSARALGGQISIRG